MGKKGKSKPIRAVVFDLDGTLYLSGKPFPQAVETVCHVATQVPVYYLSNNTRKSPVFYKNRLLRMGLPLQNESAIISALTLALQKIHQEKIKNVFFFGNPEVTEWFAAQDTSLNLRPSIDETELVLVAYHNSFDYKELCEVSWRIQRGVRFWVTHRDLVCPDSTGPVPDIGSFLSLFETAYHVHPEFSFGKPNPEILAPVLQQYSSDEILLVGDRLYTDFELAIRSGCRFALALCGETSRDDLARQARQPDIVAETVADIDFDFYIQNGI